MSDYDARKDAHDSYFAAIEAKRVRGDHLPTLPKRGEPVTAAELVEKERQIAELIPVIDDFDWLEKTRAQARALETYLRDKEMQTPMRGTQRRCEARIGQLLGPPTASNQYAVGHDLRQKVEDRSDREDFRLLANGLNGLRLDDNEWRKSRRALVKLVRNKLGLCSTHPVRSTLAKADRRQCSARCHPAAPAAAEATRLADEYDAAQARGEVQSWRIRRGSM
jgi:hypothetical protein